MWNRWILTSKALLFVSLLFILTALVACGAAAPEEPAQEAATEPQAAQQEPAAAQEPAPTAEPAPAMEQEMAEPTVVRYVESQGEIQVETNQHCGGNRPIISQFLPYVEFLVESDPVTAEFNPWLAESWETTTDAKTWTFKLREGVQFHHGYGEMTAHDFVDMALAKSNEDCQSSTTSFWKEIASAEAVDDHTVKYTMNNASLPMTSVVSNLPTGLELFSLSKKQVDEVGYDNLDDVKPASTTQIHHLMGGKDLVGASGKAGYDGYGTNTTITNEVQSLCNRESCHSSMGRSIARGA